MKKLTTPGFIGFLSFRANASMALLLELCVLGAAARVVRPQSQGRAQLSYFVKLERAAQDNCRGAAEHSTDIYGSAEKTDAWVL